MSDGTHIEWTDASWTPFRAWGNEREALGWGCEKVSEGCQHCYAETINRRLGTGLPYSVMAVEKSGGQHYLDERALLKPLSWKKPRRIFVSSMTDIFGDWVPFEWLDRVFAVMALTPQHTYQVLTKRPERMRRYVANPATRINIASGARWRVLGIDPTKTEEREPHIAATGPDAPISHGVPWPLPNVWLGASAENQHWLDIRVPELLGTPAATRFLSCEPLLSELHLEDYLSGSYEVSRGRGVSSSPRPGLEARTQLSWVIVGGESGPRARPFDLAWARSIVSQCRAAGVAVFVKQLGARPVEAVGTLPFASGPVTMAIPLGLKSRKGGEMGEWPEDLRVREWPV